MPLEGVIWHSHVFKDLDDDGSPRLDAVELSDGTIGIWDPENEVFLKKGIASREAASSLAFDLVRQL